MQLAALAPEEDIHLVVFSQAKGDVAKLTLHDYAERSGDLIMRGMIQPKATSPKEVQIDRYPAVQIEIHGSVKDVDVVFFVTVVETPQTFYQVRVVATPSKYESHAADIDSLVRKIRLVDCTEAIQLNPRSAVAYNNRGLAYENKGDHDKAIADFTDAIRLEPKDAKAYYNRGSAYKNKGEYEKAIADFTEASRLDPKDNTAYNNRGCAYECKGDHDKAIADFTKAIRLDSKGRQCVQQPWLGLREQGRLRQSDCRLHRSHSTRSERTPRHTATVAWPTRSKGDYDKAIADFTEAIRLNPKIAKAYNNRGLAYENKGDYDKAIADCTEAIRLDPKFAEAYHNRGAAYCTARATTTRRLPTAPRPSGSIRNVRQGVPQPWRGLLWQGRLRQGDCRLHRGHPARSETRHRRTAAGAWPTRARATTTRHCGLY